MKKRLYPIVSVSAILFFQLSLSAQQFSLLKDINSGNNGSSYFNFANVNGVLFFRPDDGIHGDELWKTDGTPAGTVMVKDINPGSTGSELDLFTNVNGVLYFKADDGTHGAELWKSDGTTAGTVMVKDIWTGSATSSPTSFYNANGVLYFNATDGVDGRELWKSDGTAAGTVMVKNIFPGSTVIFGSPTPNSGNPQNFTAVNGAIYFLASDNFDKSELWKTDGTTAGTTLVKDIYPGFNYALNNFINVNGTLFFTVYGGTNGNELWKSDGTTNGTVLVKPLFGGNFDNHCTAINGVLYFLESDGLWKSDGTDAGTIMLKERGDPFFNTAELLTTLNGKLYFTGYDDTHGWELWVSDGTVAGTQLVKDINAGTANSDINSFARIGSKLMFSANDGIHGGEIWTSDGTAAGTKLVQDIDPGPGDVMPPQFFEVNGAIIEAGAKVFADVTTPDFGREVWVANVPSDIGLPLELLEFKAWLDNNDGKLQWKTEHEANTSSFIVERSTDGQQFEAVGTVNASNTPGVHEYGLTDPNITSLETAIVYYRLKQIDIDGSYIYSKIVSLTLDQNRIFIVLYPNPVRTQMNLSISLPQKQRLKWQLVDNKGRIVKYGQYDLSAGNNRVSEDISLLSRGVYFMQISSLTFQKVIKVVKQ